MNLFSAAVALFVCGNHFYCNRIHLYEILTNSLLFPKCFQERSGTDLALLMLECFRTAKVPVGEDALDKIKSLFELYEHGSPDRQEFVTEAIK